MQQVALILGGIIQMETFRTEIDYVTIAQTGNAVDFGDLSHVATRYAQSCASPTRGMVAGGYNIKSS